MTSIAPVSSSGPTALDRNLSARQLSTAHVTRVQNLERTPRWLHRLLPWVNVGGGVFRVNRRRILAPQFGGFTFSGDGAQARLVSESFRSLPGLAGTDEKQLADLASAFETRLVRAGEVLTDPTAFVVVASGSIEELGQGSGGRPVRRSLAGSGQYIRPAQSAEARLRVLTDSTVFILPRDIAARFPWLEEKLSSIVTEVDGKRINAYGEAAIDVLESVDGEQRLPTTFVDYQDHPREYYLHTLQTVLRTHTRITDLYSNEYDQLREQVRVVIDVIREREEWELLNNPEFGLLNETPPAQRVPTRSGPPTPDDLDELIARVWKRPAFFVAHPKAIAAFGREATRRGVPPATVTLFGSPFLTWRGLPLIPSDKIPVSQSGETSILLLRTGAEEQGVIGLHNTGITGEVEPGLSVRYSGTDQHSVASHLITRYFSAAVLVEDAIARLDHVLVGNYHDYT
ncbi:family 2B encapsulin nanocompartment shell protein [Acetobacter suratthaniensis]|uniref:Cyclic nucleotide-binding domain-containing protein n=1 Tax=Acetobacter suratthaniensis TaxID=1502841 RepID=A0ABS3LP29_9PROT|nr:family 2B encapsulin nanocompartment shell protein [Acetobacter suratthaniensis]MBO1329124.1 cyclic nucleotide-binding domain-containing protein [Acetobacter suratthaniensis]MCX2567178.1 family 2B encapsulin nanocompartment shell protein [Acetobacter suratthaniensis]